MFRLTLAGFMLTLWAHSLPAQYPALHTQIDTILAAKAKGKSVSNRTDDAEFLRRLYLDLAGRIPTVAESRAFLADSAIDKRSRLIDQLLASQDYPKHLANVFHIMLMERLGEHPEWTAWLTKAFETNKPWDQMAREILRGNPDDEPNRGAGFFYSKRLENNGQNPVDYPALTKDVGRLFFGKNLGCAQCHDHLFIEEYKQDHFQGLFVVYSNLQLQDAKVPAVREKLLTAKIDFSSVFDKVPKKVGPWVPGGQEIEIPVLKKEELYLKPPVPREKFAGIPRFSPLQQIVENLPIGASDPFTLNIVNRLWFVMLGRGLVNPLDMHHGDNPASYPEVLQLLGKEFVAHQFDIKWMLRELALTEVYQRTSRMPEGKEPSPKEFLVGLEKRLSAETLLTNILIATGERERLEIRTDSKPATSGLSAMRTKFAKAFANSPREPELEFQPSLKGALFLLNDESILELLQPRPGNLVERLNKLNDEAVAQELYLAILVRLPATDERQEVAELLKKTAGSREKTLAQLAWALLASTEFAVNH